MAGRIHILYVFDEPVVTFRSQLRVSCRIEDHIFIRLDPLFFKEWLRWLFQVFIIKTVRVRQIFFDGVSAQCHIDLGPAQIALRCDVKYTKQAKGEQGEDPPDNIGKIIADGVDPVSLHHISGKLEGFLAGHFWIFCEDIGNEVEGIAARDPVPCSRSGCQDPDGQQKDGTGQLGQEQGKPQDQKCGNAAQSQLQSAHDHGKC